VTNGDTSDASDLNGPLADLEADMNIPRPIVAGGTGASSAPAALVNLGLTATAAEINVLDGITATVTELNYVDGVTSAIQTQIGTLTSGKQAEVLTTNGDIVVRAGGVTTRLAVGAEGTALRVASGAPAYGSGVILQTEVAAASQTSITFTGIPSWVNRVNVHFAALSTNGTSAVTVRVGDSGGIENTGYNGTVSAVGNGVSTAASVISTGFLLDFGANDTAAATRSGTLILQRVTGNTWAGSAVLGLGNAAVTCHLGGSKALSDVLTQVEITTVGGANTFDTGSVSVSWE